MNPTLIAIISFLWSAVFAAAVALSVWTGKTLTKYSGIVSREVNPVDYYVSVVGYTIVSLMFAFGGWKFLELASRTAP